MLEICSRVVSEYVLIYGSYREVALFFIQGTSASTCLHRSSNFALASASNLLTFKTDFSFVQRLK